MYEIFNKNEKEKSIIVKNYNDCVVEQIDAGCRVLKSYFNKDDSFIEVCSNEIESIVIYRGNVGFLCSDKFYVTVPDALYDGFHDAQGEICNMFKSWGFEVDSSTWVRRSFNIAVCFKTDCTDYVERLNILKLVLYAVNKNLDSFLL